MKNYHNIIVAAISYFFILLFVYASMSKILDFENFQVQIAQSPVLTSHAGVISYAVIISELAICILLFTVKIRPWGLLASSTMMSAFTVYIFIILNFSEFVPCSCGGILEKMGWTEHLIFNIGCVFLAVVSFILIRNQRGLKRKTTFAWVSLCNIEICLMVTGLFMSSEYLVKNENNFTRRFIPHPIYDEKMLDLKSNTFYFAGKFGDSIFLGNREAPLIMITIDQKFESSLTDTLSLNDYKFPFKNVSLNIVYPFFSLSDGTVPVLFEGRFPDKQAKKANVKLPYYSTIKKTGSNSYLIKTTLSKNRESVLGIYDSKTDKLELKTSILEKQKDGMFDTDGNLILELSQDKMIYTYYYRNQYIITDFKLGTKRIGYTIDTIKNAQIQTKDMESGVRKMSAPPLEVNQMQAVHGHGLFNISKLRGRYESKNRWKEANVIDVYDINTRSYKHSFYVYHHDGQNIRDILLTKQHLFILTGNKIIKYKRRL